MQWWRRSAVARLGILRVAAAQYRAARTLQCAQRRRAAHECTIRRLLAICSLQATLRNALNDRAVWHRAARTLQCAQRRKAARARAIRRLVAAFTLQAAVRNALNEKILRRLAERRAERAACVMEAGWRGHVARRLAWERAAKAQAARTIALAKLHREQPPPPVETVLQEVHTHVFATMIHIGF